ncbi:Methyltransferase type 12 [Candidatus Sulfopaludibacter sp. SbA3]|nr:Methyltransferase type 12 [Candidatus Sulfopaludibacter sp. SbA3]
MPTAYDQVLYPGLPFSRSHPDQLAVMATLFGMNPAPPQRCRVLEIACADGGNLIPMACEFPESSFVGFDLAHAVVENGQRQIAELGLRNICLDQMDLMDVGSKLGTFDYIIAHGLYSWVPEPVRDKLMATVKALLAPQGVAYISFNALPGCRVRQAFREMLLFHLRNTQDPGERIAQAREFLQCFTQAQDRPGEKENLWRTEAESLLEKSPAVLFHDELGEVYDPVYVHDFAAHAGRFGLQFLCEASYTDMQLRKYPEEVKDRARRWAGEDRVLRELYSDFLRGRPFRRTLLCHDDIPVAGDLLAERIPRLYAASPANAESRQRDLRPGAVERFLGPKGSAAETSHPLAKAALLTLIQAWPECLSFDDLLAKSANLAGQAPDAGTLGQILHGTFAAGLVHLHVLPPRCVARPGPFPQTTALARWQAGRGINITTVRHSTVQMEGETERRFLAVLDGTRDLPALIEELAQFGPHSRDEIARQIQENLGKLARLGLLVG